MISDPDLALALVVSHRGAAQVARCAHYGQQPSVRLRHFECESMNEFYDKM